MKVWSGYPPPRKNLYVGRSLFFVQGKVVSGELNESTLEEHPEINSSGDLVAARYDVASGEERPPPDALDYALTVEALSFHDDPTRLKDGALELSIQLPAEREWTGDLLGWAIEHHAERQWLRGAIDFEKSARTLSEASGW